MSIFTATIRNLCRGTSPIMTYSGTHETLLDSWVGSELPSPRAAGLGTTLCGTVFPGSIWITHSLRSHPRRPLHVDDPPLSWLEVIRKRRRIVPIRATKADVRFGSGLRFTRHSRTMMRAIKRTFTQPAANAESRRPRVDEFRLPEKSLRPAPSFPNCAASPPAPSKDDNCVC